MLLKTILEEIKTNTKIRIADNYGQEYYPTYNELIACEDYEVYSLDAIDKNEIMIGIKSKDENVEF